MSSLHHPEVQLVLLILALVRLLQAAPQTCLCLSPLRYAFYQLCTRFHQTSSDHGSERFFIKLFYLVMIFYLFNKFFLFVPRLLRWAVPTHMRYGLTYLSDPLIVRRYISSPITSVRFFLYGDGVLLLLPSWFCSSVTLSAVLSGPFSFLGPDAVFCA